MEGLRFNVLNIITLLGSLQGFMLCLLFVSSKRFYRVSTRFLVLLIFAVSLTNFTNALNEMQLQKIYPIINVCASSWALLIPFGLYYFIQYLLFPAYKFKKSEYWLVLLSTLQIIYEIVEVIWYLIDPEHFANYGSITYSISRTLEVLGVVYCLIVIVLAFQKLRYYQHKVPTNQKHLQARGLRWLKKTMIAIGVLWGLWVVPLSFQLLTNYHSDSWFHPLHLGMALIIYWQGYATYLYRDLWEAKGFDNADIKTDKNQINKGQELSSKTDEHYQNLLRLMNEDKLYQDPALSMSILAEKTGLSNGYLSQIINQKEGKNFSEFVNYYRVEEVKQKLNDSAYNHYSILGIALEAGFKSKSTFNAVFKKVTGQTPSNFRKQLQNS